MELKEKLKTYRLNEEEYHKISNLLGRPPKGVEWALFSALWSEHCSYKSSKVHLKKLFKQNPRVVVAFGENAGVVDLGMGERVAFKMESHNHPSFIEPYQGAATGVGGILRDIFTMGARPVALANYLCFGPTSADRMPHLIDGVVGGIGGYGNCVGVPTITGQTEFHKTYQNNILVNALAVGLFEEGDRVFLSKAEGQGNYVVYVGAKTGRDGVHGASMASESFDEDSESKRPTIQIGDPFFEKLLIESCIEVMKENLVVAIQDMGAAGLISSSFEMASKGGVGLDLRLDQVPLRDTSISPEEILLSESQERMLLVCEPEKFQALQKVFHHWGLDATVIGEITARKKVRLFWHDELLTDIDPDLLVEEAPEYARPFEPWEPKHRVDTVAEIGVKAKKPSEILMEILSHQQGKSRSWVYKQYDQRVGANTVYDCEAGIGAVRLPKTQRVLGLALGCRPQVMRYDAAEGAKDAVFLPALELAAKGFEPLAVTDCLNFGNPEKLDVMTEFVATTRNMSQACEALNTPIISGNVSLYNETEGQNITSTPSTGLIGLRPSLEKLPKEHFLKPGQKIYVVRSLQMTTGGQYQEDIEESAYGVGQIDVRKSSEFVQTILELSQISGVTATRVVGKYGLAYNLARMCKDSIGCETHIVGKNLMLTKHEDLFLERFYEVIFVVEDKSEFESRLHESRIKDKNVEFFMIGETIKDDFIVDKMHLKVSELQNTYNKPFIETENV